MTRFHDSSERSLASQSLVLIGEIPFSRDAAKAFRKNQSADEQLCILNALTVIQMQSKMRPADDDQKTITFNEARMGKALVRYAQQNDVLCVVNFKILDAFPQTKGLHILSTQKVRIRDGTPEGLLGWYVQRKKRDRHHREFTAFPDTETINPKGQQECLDFISLSQTTWYKSIPTYILWTDRAIREMVLDHSQRPSAVIKTGSNLSPRVCTNGSLGNTERVSWAGVFRLKLIAAAPERHRTRLSILSSAPNQLEAATVEMQTLSTKDKTHEFLHT